MSEAVLLLSGLLASQSAKGQTPATPACAIAGTVRSGATALPTLKPGRYLCQVNVIDDVAGTFAFPRLTLYLAK